MAGIVVLMECAILAFGLLLTAVAMEMPGSIALVGFLVPIAVGGLCAVAVLLLAAKVGIHVLGNATEFRDRTTDLTVHVEEELQ